MPLSPQDVTRKRQAIFRHETQKDTALFPGPDDPREFWQRAEDRNRNTADVYNQTGLPEFYALEPLSAGTARRPEPTAPPRPLPDLL